MHFLIFPLKYKYVSISNSAFAYHVLNKQSVLNDQRTHCPDDENTEGSQSVDLIVFQLPDAAVNPRKIYWIQSPRKLQILYEALNYNLPKKAPISDLFHLRMLAKNITVYFLRKRNIVIVPNKFIFLNLGQFSKKTSSATSNTHYFINTQSAKVCYENISSGICFQHSAGHIEPHTVLFYIGHQILSPYYTLAKDKFRNIFSLFKYKMEFHI